MSDTPAPVATSPPAVDPPDLKQLVDVFLNIFPEPSDEQLHHFSTALGIPYPEFEEQVFQIFKDEVDFDVDEVEDQAEDELDLFIISFFLYMPEDPSEEQIHALANLVGIEPEELEERIYKMLQAIDESDDSDEDAEDDESGEDAGDRDASV